MSGTDRVLPARVRCAEGGSRLLTFDGVVPLAKLSRLAQIALTATAPVQVSLQTQCQADGGTHLIGTLRGGLVLRCERCLQPLDWSFEIDVNLRLVRSEAEEQRWLERAEPLLIEDDELPLHALIEDEILLALPMAPAHAPAGCSAGDGNRYNIS